MTYIHLQDYYSSDPWLLELQNRKHDEYIACICKTSKILKLLPS